VPVPAVAEAESAEAERAEAERAEAESAEAEGTVAASSSTSDLPLETESVVRKELREMEYRCVYAGADEEYGGVQGGKSIVRSLLAAKGDITQQELSEPTGEVLQKEKNLRTKIVNGDPSLQEWTSVGFYDQGTANHFLAAAEEHLGQEVVVLELVQKKTKTKEGKLAYCYKYDFNSSYSTKGAISLTTLKAKMEEMHPPLLLERYGTHFSPFLYIKRPASLEELITAIKLNNYGVWYDRSSTNAAPAIAKLTRVGGEVIQRTQSKPLPPGTGRVMVTVRRSPLHNSL
jgi:hypothetical protein